MNAGNPGEYLKIEHVCKTFGKGESRSEVLRDISLDVGEGRVHRHHRTLRLRQVDAAQHRGRV